MNSYYSFIENKMSRSFHKFQLMYYLITLTMDILPQNQVLNHLEKFLRVYKFYALLIYSLFIYPDYTERALNGIP